MDTNDYETDVIIDADQAEQQSGPSSPDSGVNDLSDTTTDKSTTDKSNPSSASCGSGEPSPHVVQVVVEAGEVLVVRMGDGLRQVVGPATIRMVSNTGPPAPMHMRAPPGHVVQQIVDEKGVLTHVILSPQPPHGYPYANGNACPGSANHSSGIGSATHQWNSGPSAGAFPPGYLPQYHHHPLQSGVHPCLAGLHNSSMASSHGPTVASPADDRTARQRAKLREKIRHQGNNEPLVIPAQQAPCYSPAPSQLSQRISSNGSSPLSHDLYSCSSGSDSHDAVDEDKRHLKNALSSMQPPQVVNVSARKAVVQIRPPNLPEHLASDRSSDLRYELQFSQRKDGSYDILYTGDANEITMKDLKPATEYFVRVIGILDDMRGRETEPVSLKTECTFPEPPDPPKLCSRAKTNIILKWSACIDNGSKVNSYILQYSKGQGPYVECYSGSERQFKVSKLLPSQCYGFRLAAINAYGTSEFSEVLKVCTPGTAPLAPDPPRLSDAQLDCLLLTWIKRPIDKEFTLQQEEEPSEHGFLAAYTGPEVSYKVTSLRRNTTYRFRLCSSNEDGRSPWSDVVTYRTKSDVPGPPSKPQTKGRVHATSFRLTWDPPKDNGGSGVERYVTQLDSGTGFQQVYDGEMCECSCSNLLPGYTHRARVAARNSAGLGQWSESAYINTKAVPPKACPRPYLTGKPKAHTLHMKWGSPEDTGGSPIMFYEVQLMSMDNSKRQVYHGADTECVVAGLSPGRSYLLQVRAVNEAGGGDWSEPVEVLSGASVPEIPEAPLCLCKSPHCVTVTWTPPCDNGAKISEYKLECLRPSSEEYTQVYYGPDQLHDVKGLQPHTAYSFRVQAINSSGTSQPSEPTCVTTPPSSPAAIVHVEATATATSARISWLQPEDNGSPITHYNLELGKYQLSGIKSTDYEIEDLQPETVYRARVQAVNVLGAGTFSPAVKVTTLAQPPQPPSLECQTITWNTVKLRWSEVDKKELYTVLMMKAGSDLSQVVYAGPLYQCKVGKLQEATEYHFSICAQNEAGEGPQSSLLSIKTSKAPPHSLKAPSISDLRENKVTVSWQAAKAFPGDTMEYRLQLCMSSTGHDYRQIYQGACTHHRVSGLDPNQSYSVRVCPVRISQAIDGCNELPGAYSPGTSFITLKPQILEQPCKQEVRREIPIWRRIQGVVALARPQTERQYAVIMVAIIFAASVCMAGILQYFVG